MELESKYTPGNVENKWYQYWIDHNLFSSKPDGREPYTIVIPPPNVTGVLHMGHMLNETIQDILVRRARMEGKMHVGYLAQTMLLLQQRLKLLTDFLNKVSRKQI